MGAIVLIKRDSVTALVCILFLLASVGSIGGGGRRRAKEAVCVGNLKRWGVVWQSYLDEHSGIFPHRVPVSDWPATVEPYYRNRRLLLCPEARRTFEEGARNPFMAWERECYHCDTTSVYRGGYCINYWISDEEDRKFWRSAHVSNASSVPILADGQWTDAEPRVTDEPPAHEEDLWMPNQQEMQRFCVSRHSGTVNAVFMDGSVRKVGLKFLWRLEWHREWPEDLPLPVWPPWMEKFKEPP